MKQLRNGVKLELYLTCKVRGVAIHAYFSFFLHLATFFQSMLENQQKNMHHWSGPSVFWSSVYNYPL